MISYSFKLCHHCFSISLSIFDNTSQDSIHDDESPISFQSAIFRDLQGGHRQHWSRAIDKGQLNCKDTEQNKRKMTLPFHMRRLLYTSLFLGFVYVTVQLVRTQSGLWYLEELDRETRLAGHQACRHPNLEVQNPAIMKFMKAVPPIDCGEKMDWVHVNGSTMYITDEARAKHGDIQCSFTDVIRANEYANHDGVTTQTHTEYNLEESDFVKVYCKSSQGTTWHSLLAGIRHDQDLVDRLSWDRVPNDSLRLNVLMWGFDSLARNMFVRKLPRTYHYLRDTLQAVELQGYNIVGDGTPQALIPILTGKTELELPETRKRMGDKASYVNVYPFVWKEFQDNGYVTGSINIHLELLQKEHSQDSCYQNI